MTKLAATSEAAIDNGDLPQVATSEEVREFVFSVPQFQPGDALSIPAPDGTRLKLRLPRNAMPGDRMFMAKNEDGEWVIKRVSRPSASASSRTAKPGLADEIVQDLPDMNAEDDVTDPGVVSIMCLGDSHTHGWHHAGGYRIHLWELMEHARWKVRFVGKLRNGPKTIDQRHEGWPGYTIEELITGRGEDFDIILERDLSRFAPDVILLFIGSNDVIQEIELENYGSRLQMLLNTIQCRLPKVKVVLANVPNVRGMEAIVQSANQQFLGVEKSCKESGLWLRLIDVNSILGAHDFHDSAHLNIRGFNKVARAFFKVLEDQDVIPAESRNLVTPRRSAQALNGSSPTSPVSRNSSQSPPSPASVKIVGRSGMSGSNRYSQVVEKCAESEQGELIREKLLLSPDADARRREEAAREDIKKRMQHLEESNEEVKRAADQAKRAEEMRISGLEKSLTAKFGVGDFISGLEDDELACAIS